MRKERFPRNYHGAWLAGKLVSFFGPCGACLDTIDNLGYMRVFFEDCKFSQVSSWVLVEDIDPVNEASRRLLEALC